MAYTDWNNPYTQYPNASNFSPRSPIQGDWDKEDVWQPDVKNFQSPTGGAGPDSWFMQQGYMPTPGTGNIEAQYANLGQSRGLQESALQNLNQYATGQKSAAKEAMAGAMETADVRARAQARAARSPAEARAALYSGASAGQTAARSGATAAMQEQLGAQQAYLTGAGQMRQGDVSSYSAAQSERLNQIKGDAMIKDVAAKYMALGLSDKEAERKARIDYEKMKMAGYEGWAGRKLAGDLQSDQQEYDFLKSMIGGGTSMMGGLMAGLAASDKDVKKNVYSVASCAGAKNLTDDPNNFLEDEAIQKYAPDEEYLDTVKKTKEAEPLTKERSKELEPIDWNQKGGKYVGRGMEKAGEEIASPMKEGVGQKMADAINARNRSATLSMIDDVGEAPVSDVNQKNIKEFMDKTKAVNFEYKHPEKHGRGEFTGIIAQDAEKSRLGRNMVIKDEEGVRHLNMEPRRFNPMVLAGLANLNNRLRKVEGR
jgi:hypothetical protein